MRLRWLCMSWTQFIILFVGGGVQWWRRRFSERKEAEMGVRWSQSQHWKSGRKLYEQMHYSSKVSYGWRWMHEHKGTNLAKRDSMRIIWQGTQWRVKLFCVVVLILRSRGCPPKILGGQRYWERNGSRVERDKTHNSNFKQRSFFFTSEKGNLDLGLKFDCLN